MAFSTLIGIRPKSKRKKRKGIGKMIAKSVGDNRMEINIMKTISDYNTCDKE